MHLDIYFQSKNLHRLLDILESLSGRPRIIGGAVRDALLGIQPVDIDIATIIPPEQLLAILPNYQINVVPTGIKFGTVTAILGGESFEITTTRRDIKCMGRKTSVEFTEDFYIDAKRRDFTINAISYSLSAQKIYDYFDGAKHLKEKRVVFIGNAEDRIKEDYLRILRFFRISARYANSLDTAGYNACVKLRHGIANLSRERIISELNKMLAYSTTNNCLQQMIDGQIFDSIDPDIIWDSDAFNRLLLSPACEKRELSTSYALLLHSNTNIKPALVRLKAPNSMITSILLLQKYCRAANTHGAEFATKKIWLRHADKIEQFLLYLLGLGMIDKAIYNEYSEYFRTHSHRSLPVNGEDVKNLGFIGKDIAGALSQIEDKWIESDFNLTKEALLNSLKGNPQ